MKRVQTPGGRVIQVPDDATDEEIRSLIDELEPAPQAQQVAAPEPVAPQQPEGPGRLQQLVQDTPQRVVQGLTAPIRGIEQNLRDIGQAARGERPPETEETPLFEGQQAAPMQQIRLAAGFMLNADPEARKDMLRNVLGDEVQFSRDSQGNELVSFRGETGFVDRPGFDIRDATQLAADVLKFVPAARIAGALGSTLLRAGVGGGIAGGTEAASQAASGAFGSEQGLDPARIAGVTAAGGVGEAGASALRRFIPAAREQIGRAQREGIGLKDEPGQQVRQVAQAVGRRAAPERGEALPGIQARVQELARQERQEASALFEAAKSSPASLPRRSIQSLRFRLGKQLEDSGFDTQHLPKVRSRLQKLDELLGTGKAQLDSVKLNRLENWRKGLRKARSTDPEENLAVGRMKQQYDKWLDDQFNADMVSGDAQAIQKWKDARAAWRRYKGRFDNDKVIKNLVENDAATVESMRSWILGASDTRLNKEAGQVVSRLNELIGSSSPEMGRLRAEVWLNVVEPLLRDNPLRPPNISQFLTRYEEVIKRNPTLVRNLWPNGLKELEDLQKFARGIARRPGAQPREVIAGTQSILDRIWDGAVTLTVGHGIARGGFHVRTGRGIVGQLRRATAGVQGRKTILREALDVDPKEQMIPPGTGALLGATAATQEE